MRARIQRKAVVWWQRRGRGVENEFRQQLLGTFANSGPGSSTSGTMLSNPFRFAVQVIAALMQAQTDAFGCIQSRRNFVGRDNGSFKESSATCRPVLHGHRRLCRGAAIFCVCADHSDVTPYQLTGDYKKRQLSDPIQWARQQHIGHDAEQPLLLCRAG
ncbi:hypothetical protein MTO96_013083 [Rhipicephalus appendiculatus]